MTDGWRAFQGLVGHGRGPGPCAVQLLVLIYPLLVDTVDRTSFFERLPGTLPLRSPGLFLPELEKVDLATHFSKRLTSVDGVAHGPLPSGAVSDLVSSILFEYGAREYLGWDDVGVAGMHQRLKAGGLIRIDGHMPDRGERRSQHLFGYRNLVAGLTGADAGLVETGSIVLRAGPGKPRMASLIPLVHIAVLSIHRLSRSLCHYAADHPAAIEGTSNLVIITGPSRTGDIEQQLNLGVHGPKHLHVILVD